MKALIKKEFELCLHPTAVIFLLFAALVFVPNYPYEVIFFFSGLSVFFICTAARENGDAAFTLTLPVKKREVPLARIFVVLVLQCALLTLTAACIAVKQAFFPRETLVNLASNSANLAFCGFGALLSGVFDLAFFPLYYKDPRKVGAPFAVAAALQLTAAGALIVLRHTPFFEPLTPPDFLNGGVKLAVLFGGLALFGVMGFAAARLSAENFEKVDL